MARKTPARPSSASSSVGPTRSPKLRKGDRIIFDLLVRAAKNGDLALVSAIRKSDRAAVAIVCALETLDNGNIQPVPFAVLVESSDEFEDPFL